MPRVKRHARSRGRPHAAGCAAALPAHAACTVHQRRGLPALHGLCRSACGRGRQRTAGAQQRIVVVVAAGRHAGVRLELHAAEALQVRGQQLLRAAVAAGVAALAADRLGRPSPNHVRVRAARAAATAEGRCVGACRGGPGVAQHLQQLHLLARHRAAAQAVQLRAQLRAAERAAAAAVDEAVQRLLVKFPIDGGAGAAGRQVRLRRRPRGRSCLCGVLPAGGRLLQGLLAAGLQLQRRGPVHQHIAVHADALVAQGLPAPKRVHRLFPQPTQAAGHVSQQRMHQAGA